MFAAKTADESINALIEELCRNATRMTTGKDERQQIIEQVAMLRASQNPTIVNNH